MNNLYNENELNITVEYNVTIRKYTVAELKELVQAGVAIDITNATNENAINEPYTVVGYALSFGKPHGKLFLGLKTWRLYAITKPTIAINIF